MKKAPSVNASDLKTSESYSFTSDLLQSADAGDSCRKNVSFFFFILSPPLILQWDSGRVSVAVLCKTEVMFKNFCHTTIVIGLCFFAAWGNVTKAGFSHRALFEFPEG